MSNIEKPTIQQDLLSKINGNEYINRRNYLQPPVMPWINEQTQLNATNMNKMSTSIKNIQDEFGIETNNVQSIFSDIVSNSAGWRSIENSTAEIFNDYENNKAIADYSHAEGHETKAGKFYYGIGEDGCDITSGEASHAEGIGTIATSDYQHVQGKYNLIDEDNSNGISKPGNIYAHIVGGGTSDTDRKNIHTLDWDGSAWFAKNISVDGDATFGIKGNGNKHTINGTLNVSGVTTLASNLIVKGNTTLGSNNQNSVTIKGPTTLEDNLRVNGKTTLVKDLSVSANVNISGLTETNTLKVKNESTLNGLTVTGDSTFNSNVIFGDNSNDKVTINSTLNVLGTSTLKVSNINQANITTLNVSGETNTSNITSSGLLKVTEGIESSGSIKSDADIIVTKDNSNISLTTVHNHVDGDSLKVASGSDKTVQNAIDYSAANLIGKTTLDTGNLGGIKHPTLSQDTIYGVAQYSINLVKSLLNAYILDNDADDPESRSAIDKLIEVADWIKDDKAGAGKIITDITSLTNNKLNKDIYDSFITTSFNPLNTLVSEGYAKWNEAYSQRHTHDNYEVLKTIDTTKVNDWDVAYSRQHTHSNKSVLNGITSDKITLWDGAAALLDGVDQDAIDGIIADGQRITDNTKRLDAIQIDQLPEIEESIQNITENKIPSIESAIGSNTKEGSIIYRLNALETKLNTLISAGDSDPTSDTATTYYIKY